MKKNTITVEISPVLSVVLTSAETADIKALSESLGVSLSHLGRALIRLGLQAVVGERNKEKTLLKLVKLGK